jgi:hypothetical protein
MNLKVEDLRRKAWIGYGGEQGVNLVNRQVIEYGLDEENLTEEQEKELLNRIIKKVFVEPLGLDKTKHLLAMEVKHLPGYDTQKMHQGMDPKKPIDEVRRIEISDKTDIKKFILAFMLISAFILSAVFAYYAISFKPSDACERKTAADRDECYLLLAITQKEPLFCEKISSQDTMHSCIYSVSVSSQNMELCEKIPGDSHQNIDLRMRCQMCVAFKSSDTSLCNELGDTLRSDECKRHIERGFSAIC